MKLFKSIVKMFSSEEVESGVINLGRNEMCWCGSGKKYKKCHLVEDERKADKRRASRCGKT
ncbi:MAG: SEC-C metal-binding domain-containing protein [Thermodesulfovibrionales bacterium]